MINQRLCIRAATAVVVAAQMHMSVASNVTDNLRIYVYEGLQDETKSHREYFKIESELIDGMRHRGRVVTNPENANVFWIPHSLVAHWIDRRELQQYWHNKLRPFLRDIEFKWPYFNASGGRNHVFVYAMDEGPMCEIGHSNEVFSEDPVFKRIVHPMIHIGYYGIHNKTSMLQRQSPTRKRCFDSSRDIVMPQWNQIWKKMDNSIEDTAKRCASNPDTCDAWFAFLQNKARHNKHIFFFKGQVIIGRNCSKGIRPWVRDFCASASNECAFGSQYSMGDALFALCPAGWACWSTRYFDAIEHMAIPVRLADNAAEPFSNVVNPQSIQEKIQTGNPTQLPKDGGIEFARLKRSAHTWRSHCSTNVLKHKCIQHALSRKLMAIAIERHNFRYDRDAQNSAFSNLEHALLRRSFSAK